MKKTINILVLRGAVTKYLGNESELEQFPNIAVSTDSIIYLSLGERNDPNLLTKKLQVFRDQMKNHMEKYNPHIIFPHPYLSHQEIAEMKNFVNKDGTKPIIAIATAAPGVSLEQLREGADFAFNINDLNLKIDEFTHWLKTNQEAILQGNFDKIIPNELTSSIRAQIKLEAEKHAKTIVNALTKNRFQRFLSKYFG